MSKILVFGGTRFFGKKLVNILLQNEYDVTIATRGKSKDSFGDKINRIKVDRSSREDLERTFNKQKYDIVFDNICYSPNEAKNVCDIFSGKVKKYIFTSTMSVYDEGFSLKEKDFNPYDYTIKYGDRKDFIYGVGKRLAEAVFFKEATFPVVAVRFPVVIGEDDYTRRLSSYVDKISKGKAFYIDNLKSPMSFITADEAGEFLHWIGTKDFIGPINACSNNTITIEEIIKICEEKLNREWMNSEKTGDIGAFNGFYKYTLDNSIARSLGFDFRDVRNEVKRLIKYS